VKAGDNAILKTLEKAVSIMGINTDMLMEYHTGVAKDEVLEKVAGVATNVADLACLKDDSCGDLLEMSNNPRAVTTRLHGMFSEMSGMLSGNLDAAGHATATRALNMFSARFSNIDPLTSNKTQLMHELASESTVLLNTVRAASSSKRSSSAEAAHRAAFEIRDLNEQLSERNRLLGVYRNSAVAHKEVQRQLSPINLMSAIRDDMRKTAATSFLLELDRSWWTIREKLDAYLDAADSQQSAMVEAISVLEDYTAKCTADFTDLKRAHGKAYYADNTAIKQLQDTWHAVEHEVGLLAARISDSKGFLQLTYLDAGSADFETNRTEVCGDGPTANKAALLAVDAALSQGYAKQTWLQLEGVFGEMDMLRDRIMTHGLKVPSNQTMVQALERAIHAYSESVDARSDIALEVAQRACGNEPALVQMPAADQSEKIGILEAALKKVNEVEGEKEHEMDANLKLEKEKNRLEVQALEDKDKMNSLLQEKILNLEKQVGQKK